jgi:hypothetical protein
MARDALVVTRAAGIQPERGLRLAAVFCRRQQSTQSGQPEAADESRENNPENYLVVSAQSLTDGIRYRHPTDSPGNGEASAAPCRWVGFLPVRVCERSLRCSSCTASRGPNLLLDPMGCRQGNKKAPEQLRGLSTSSAGGGFQSCFAIAQ